MQVTEYDIDLAGDPGDLTLSNAVRTGVHDSVSEIVKWTGTATVALFIASVVLPEQTRKRILRRIGL